MNSNLYIAQNLKRPSREEVLRRDIKVRNFWLKNKETLVAAWNEWENEKENQLQVPVENLVDTQMKNCFEKAWENVELETEIDNLVTEVSPGVFIFNFFNLNELKQLNEYLTKIENANIPIRPPYGIVLNRKGAMLDPRSEGYLAAPSFQKFYFNTINKYMRPLARYLFPEVVGYDSQTFGFSIEYKPETDHSIRLHTDASSVTLNINLNLPNEKFTGSEVIFQDFKTGQLNEVVFKPGMALIHRGNVAHAAKPIQSGERRNFILWLYGENMQVPTQWNIKENISAKERWKVQNFSSDGIAPF